MDIVAQMKRLMNFALPVFEWSKLSAILNSMCEVFTIESPQTVYMHDNFKKDKRTGLPLHGHLSK
jgi:hypothetical protein